VLSSGTGDLAEFPGCHPDAGVRVPMRGAMLLDRLAGILLTAVAVILLTNGFTDLVPNRLHR